MPEEKRPLKVFLSHAHGDAKSVRAFYNRLTADGVDARLSWRYHWWEKSNRYRKIG
jgi:hypothetical protein